jgi:hypothetical protein
VALTVRPDALFKAEYVIPFLGLDKVGAVDPGLEQRTTRASETSRANLPK